MHLANSCENNSLFQNKCDKSIKYHNISGLDLVCTALLDDSTDVFTFEKRQEESFMKLFITKICCTQHIIRG